MHQQQYQFGYDIYENIHQLPAQDALLMEKARAVTEQAYAPYSRFLVGAAAILANGEIVTGTNQENASYPVGICAERVLLSAAASVFPGIPIHTIAISYNNLQGKSGVPVFPCGICRQSLVEYQERFKQPIRLMLGGMEGEVHIIRQAGDLLPFGFTASDMEQ